VAFPPLVGPAVERDRTVDVSLRSSTTPTFDAPRGSSAWSAWRNAAAAPARLALLGENGPAFQGARDVIVPVLGGRRGDGRRPGAEGEVVNLGDRVVPRRPGRYP